MPLPNVVFAGSTLMFMLISPIAWADSAYTWGTNILGQLGDGTTMSRSVPAPVPGLDNGVTAISGGNFHTLVVRDGAVYAWGYNGYGQLGDGTTTNSLSPVAIPSLSSGVTAVSAALHSLALQNGAVYAWGNNWAGQLGDGTTTERHSPVPIPSLSGGVTAVAAGGLHSLAIKDGAVYAWGRNSDGELGDGTQTYRTSPVPVVGLSSGVTDIAASGGRSFAVQDGALYAWGGNASGALGDGTTTDRHLPVLIPSLASGVTAVAPGLAVKDGEVYTWGYNGRDYNYSPVLVPGLSDIVDVSVGLVSYYALASDGSLWVWGGNLDGELGLGDTFYRLTPTHLLPPPGYVYTSIDADGGGSHVVASLAVVPEPNSTLLLVGVAGLFLRRRHSGTGLAGTQIR